MIGLMERAAQQQVPQWPLRALNAEIFAPVGVGPAELIVETMRQGSGMSTLMVRLHQEGEVRARATAIFGKARVEDREQVTLTPPKLRPFEELETVLPNDLVPKFTQHLDYRPVDPLPFSGAQIPGALGWVQFKQRPATLSMHDVIGLIDAYWPASFAIEPMPRPMATVSFTFEPLVDPATLDAGAPFMYRCAVPASHHGYAVELRELWTRDGKLAALNQQSFVTIK